MKRILLPFLMFPLVAHAQYVDGLPAATAIAPGNVVIVCQGGTAGVAGTCTTAQSTVGAIQVLTGYTVSTLPACTVAGTSAYVTDALSPTWNGALTGGGSVVVPVFCNGTTWRAN